MPGLFFLVNPHAAKGGTKSNFQKLIHSLEKEQIQFQVRATQKIEDISKVLNEAIQKGYKTIVSVGGDGTHHQIVNHLMHLPSEIRSKLAFTAFPAGTGNDWIRHHKIPRSADAWVSMITQKKKFGTM